MTLLLRRDKKGISIMVSYVLLIVLAIGISAAVWTFLKFYLPSNEPQCPDDVNLVVSGVECANGVINMTFENRGLFSIDGAYVKIGDKNRVVKDQLCFKESSSGTSGACNIFFYLEQGSNGINGLEPGASFTKSFNKTSNGIIEAGEKELEIEPVIFVENNKSSICTKALIQRDVTCF